MLRLLYLTLIIVCIAPTIPGFAGVVISAFGYIPPLDLNDANFNGFREIFLWSGVWTSITLTFVSTIVSALLTVLISFSILSSNWASNIWRNIESSLSPLLAIPHVAFAIGLAFLLSPTGWIARLLEPYLSNSIFNWLVQDSWAIGLIIALTLKEVPFLLLMSIPILKQLNVKQSQNIASSLGYNREAFWWKCLFPQWLEKIRFPLIAIIAFSASVVDVALIIGPTNPPTFAVLVLQWFSDADLSLMPRAAAGALALFIICSILILLARFIEWLLVKKLRDWQYSGRTSFKLPGKTLFGMVLSIFVFAFIVLVVWSFAQRWRYPDLLPSASSLRFWISEWPSITPVISESLQIAVISSTIATFFALVAQEYRIVNSIRLPHYVIAIPMLVPQLSLLFGMQVSTLYLSSENYYLWVIWSHLFFAFPYIYLALDGPWSSFNQSYMYTALSLGKSPLSAWFKIKLPMLFTAITFAWAIGTSVSLAQYLPTLMLGAGRVSTLTTEAVALASGFDRRVTAIYAIWQTLLPLIIFAGIMLINQKQSVIIRTRTKDKTASNESLSKQPRHL